MRKIFIFIIMLGLQLGWSDKFIVRGAYENDTKLVVNMSQPINLYDPNTGLYIVKFEEEDSYPIKSCFGGGVEYELDKFADRFSFSVGYDQLAERPLNSVDATGVVTLQDPYGNEAEMSLSNTVSLSDTRYQVSYYYGKLRYYFNDQFYLGGLFRKANILLIGNSFEELKFNTAYSFGLVAGIYIDDFMIELSSVENKLEAQSTYPDLSVIIAAMPTVQLSAGYVFDLRSKKSEAVTSRRAEPIADTDSARDSGGSTADLQWPTQNTIAQ